MSFPAKSVLFIFLLTTLSLLFVLQLHPSVSIEAASHGRKLLMSGGKVVVKKEVGGKAGRFDDGWELREAPLGPDSLHHHGSSPKKPKTP